jgi:hypothetical protein
VFRYRFTREEAVSSEWKITVELDDVHGTKVARVFEREVRNRARGAWVQRATLKAYDLDHHGSARMHLGLILKRLAS